jgi:hypothetical protein
MLEHAVRLDLVKWRLEETLLFQLVVIIIGNRGELLSFFVKELEVGGALVLDVFRFFRFVGPLILVTPFFLVFFLIVASIFEVVLLLSLFAVCRRLMRVQLETREEALTLQSGR